MSVVYKKKAFTVEKNKEGYLSLKIWASSISDITSIIGLSELKDLEVLHLSNNRITEIKGLDYLINLKELYLEKNRITEIKGVEKLTNLRVLNLGNNRISEIKGLEKLKNLRVLNLGNNRISEINGLENLINLKFISLEKNKITEVKGLDGLANLQKLVLLNNEIIFLKGFGSLTNLQKLYLGTNPIWRGASKQFGKVKKSGFVSNRIKNTQALVRYCHELRRYEEDERKSINSYHRKLKIFLLLTIIGIVIMSMGLILTYLLSDISEERVTGIPGITSPINAEKINLIPIIMTVCGVLMVLVFKHLTKVGIKFKVICGLIGLFIVIIGIIILNLGYILGIFILIMGILWMVFCADIWKLYIIPRRY